MCSKECQFRTTEKTLTVCFWLAYNCKVTICGCCVLQYIIRICVTQSPRLYHYWVQNPSTVVGNIELVQKFCTSCGVMHLTGYFHKCMQLVPNLILVTSQKNLHKIGYDSPRLRLTEVYSVFAQNKITKNETTLTNYVSVPVFKHPLN